MVGPRTPYRADVPIASSANPRPLAARRLRLGSVVAAVALVVVLGGCGASDDGGGGPVGPADDGPRVADARFDGRFDIVEVVLDGTDVPIGQEVTLDIEAEFGGLTVRPGCNTYFGSFSLDDDGRASFTVTGGTEMDCGRLTGQERAILDALDAIDHWEGTEVGFRFAGSASSVSVSGPVG